MFRKVMFSIVMALCCLCSFAASRASADAWSDTYNASCMIRGATGFVVAQDRDNFYILTAGHVVYDDQNHAVADKIWGCWFFNGRQSAYFWPKLLFYVHQRDDANGIYDDLAVLSIQRSWFKDNSVQLPAVLQLAPRGYVPRVGTTFVTFGHPGSWLTGYSGTVSQVWRNRFIIDPAPLRGRSGSAIVSTNSRVLGLVLITDGTCISSERIYELLQQAGSYRDNTESERAYLRRIGY